MNFKKNILTIFVGFLLLIFLSVNSYGFNGDIDEKDNSVLNISEDVLEARINSISDKFDIRVTAEIKKIIYQYTKTNRNSSEIVLGKTAIFFPLFEHTLKEHNVPDELKYLSIVESGLKQDARSKVGATGLWQFMKTTGKMYGLKINNTVDQRRDPVRSTEAAAKFLKDLYHQFDSWTLALAAYNCGPGNVRKAIRKSGSRNFWVLKKYLPRETRRYIPKFIAMMYLVNYYDAHNLTPKTTNLSYLNVMRIPVDSRLNFNELSKITGLSIRKIKAINPSYIRNYVPGHRGEYYINLPQESVISYLHYKDKTHLEIQSFVGDYFTNYTKVMDLNKINEDNSLQSISVLNKLKLNVLKSSQNSQLGSINVSKHFFMPGNYKIRKGETLMEVALKMNKDLNDLIKWNKIDINHLPAPGSVIFIGSNP